MLPLSPKHRGWVKEGQRGIPAHRTVSASLVSPCVALMVERISYKRCQIVEFERNIVNNRARNPSGIPLGFLTLTSGDLPIADYVYCAAQKSNCAYLATFSRSPFWRSSRTAEQYRWPSFSLPLCLSSKSKWVVVSNSIPPVRSPHLNDVTNSFSFLISQ